MRENAHLNSECVESIYLKNVCVGKHELTTVNKYNKCNKYHYLK